MGVVSPTVTEAPAPTAAPNNNNVSTPTAAPTNDNIGIETESPTLAPTASPTKSPTKAPTSSCTDTTASFKVVGVKKAKTCANIATRATLCDKELKNTNTPGGTFVKTICPVACNNCPSDNNDDAPPNKCEDTTSK